MAINFELISTYTVGAGGSALPPAPGSTGGVGVIIVEEFY